MKTCLCLMCYFGPDGRIVEFSILVDEKAYNIYIYIFVGIFAKICLMVIWSMEVIKANTFR